MPNHIPAEIVNSTDIEVLEKQFKEQIKMRDNMCGSMYWNIVNDDCIWLKNRINYLKGRANNE
ncbi:MAG: hypothetical protein K0Q53_158 [Massilibacillus sp.]|jgi:hypothetical protein|nr:hypothetical protein [Massilibacillus sp.]